MVFVDSFQTMPWYDAYKTLKHLGYPIISHLFASLYDLLLTYLQSQIDPMKSEDGIYFDMLWSAPELIGYAETGDRKLSGSQKGDIFSFAVIVTEIMSKNVPYGDQFNCSAKGTS